MRKKFLSMVLVFVLGLSMAVPAFAAEQSAEIEAAGAYLRERGVYQGDGSGDLMLDKGLTRAEMAAVLTRLHGEGQVNPSLYTWACYFTDVPDWAKPYVGYCTANLLVAGYDASRYGPHDMVTPAMACTVVLRCCGSEDGEGKAWTYGTACDYAVGLGLINQSTAQAPTITRGEMAVLIRRAWEREETSIVTPEPVSRPQNDTTSQTYTISVDHWSREDFSQQANPRVFTGVYSRELYNAIRQTLVDGNSDNPGYTMVSQADFSAVRNLLGRMDGVVRYEQYVPENFADYWKYLDYFAVSATVPDGYQDALLFIQPAIEQANRLSTDSKKVEYLNDYLCTLLTYQIGAAAGVTQTFSPHSSELKAACGSYAKAFKFLCGTAGIPCFTVTTATHGWNMVYADGRWLHVDVSTNDLRNYHSVLLAETYPGQTDQAPEATAFLKELLVPGSTK